MQLSNLFLAILFTTAAIADGSVSGKKHHRKTIKSECKEFFSLEHLELSAANTTALADKTQNNATKISEIQAKASKDASKLAALKSNLTLVEECAIFAAAEKLEHDCNEISRLDRFLAFAGNATAVAIKAQNNSTRIGEFAAKASKDAAKLEKLESNSTLVSLCPIFDAAEKEKHRCAEIKKLEKFIAFVDNSTALADKTQNNATRIDHFKAKASKDATRLAKLQSNATLVADCAALESSGPQSLADTQAGVSGVATANTTGTATTGTATTGAATTSNAGTRLFGNFGVPLSIVITTIGIVML